VKQGFMQEHALEHLIKQIADGLVQHAMGRMCEQGELSVFSSPM
jgi:hypothetical protein